MGMRIPALVLWISWNVPVLLKTADIKQRWL